jgi:hypothetical protein
LGRQRNSTTGRVGRTAHIKTSDWQLLNSPLVVCGQNRAGVLRESNYAATPALTLK